MLSFINHYQTSLASEFRTKAKKRLKTEYHRMGLLHKIEQAAQNGQFSVEFRCNNSREVAYIQQSHHLGFSHTAIGNATYVISWASPISRLDDKFNAALEKCHALTKSYE